MFLTIKKIWTFENKTRGLNLNICMCIVLFNLSSLDDFISKVQIYYPSNFRSFFYFEVIHTYNAINNNENNKKISSTPVINNDNKKVKSKNNFSV